MKEKIERKIRLARQYITSSIKIKHYKEDFADIEGFCMFIGYPRSGHTLIRSLLDAHPEIIIANELNTLRYIRYLFRRDQIFYLLLENSRNFSIKNSAHTGYDYTVQNQWQGRYRKLRIIGDKRGGGTLKKLYYRPRLLARLVDIIGVPIRFIHTVRNPFHNISTLYTNGHYNNFEQSIDYYFFLADEVERLKAKIGSNHFLDVHNEAIIQNPQNELKRITDFLGVDSSEDYLNDCSNIIFKTPHKTHDKAPWADELIEKVQNQICQYSFLDGYTLDR